MKAYSDHDCHERVMFSGMDEHAVQPVIVEDTVIDTFRGGALVIDLFISVRATRDFGVKPDVPFGVGLDDHPVPGICAAVFAFGAVVFAIRAAPDEVPTGFVITVWSHAQFFLTERSSVFVNGDGVRDGFRPPAFIIQVDKSPDLFSFQQTVSRVIIHGGVQAHVFNGNSRHMFFQFMESDKEADRIMLPCAGEAQGQGDVSPEFTVIAG